MNWICGFVSFLWFCPTVNLISQTEFEGHLKFFTELDVVLSAPEEICPVLKNDKRMQFQGIAHLVHDERLSQITQIEASMLTEKLSKCLNECTCGALMTLEDKVVGLTDLDSKKLTETQEALTNEYFSSCREKSSLDCDSKIVKEISDRAGF